MPKFTSSRLTNEIFLSLNVGFSVAYAFLTYLDSTQANLLGPRFISWINDLFHLNKNGMTGLEVAFIGPMLAVALGCFLLLLLLHSSSAALGRVILDPVACIISRAAAPAC